MYRYLALMIFLFLVGCGWQNDEHDLRETIVEMVALIDEGQDQKLISEYIYSRNGISSAPKKISSNKRKGARAVLIRAQDLSPKFSENNTLAVYESTLFKKPLWFVKQQNRWRMMNEQPNK